MVLYNRQALLDFDDIFNGLLLWKKHQLSYSFCQNYIKDMRQCFDTIDLLPVHQKAVYFYHLRYGEYVYRYRRNRQTQWYACYNYVYPNVFVNKISNNYLTS